MKYLRLAFYAIIAVLLFVMAVSNMELVEVTLLPMSFIGLPAMSLSLPLFIVILVSIAIGVILAYLLMFRRAFVANRARTKAETARRQAETELERLRQKTGESNDEVLALLK